MTASRASSEAFSAARCCSLFTWALIHHMLGGIRHLIWDTGAGLDKQTVEIFALGDNHRLHRADGPSLDRRLLPDGRALAMATPLKRVRGLGAAHHGTETFWRQRLTAVANVPLVIFLIWFDGRPCRRELRHGEGLPRQPGRRGVDAGADLVSLRSICGSVCARSSRTIFTTSCCKTASLMLATFFAALVGIASTLAILKISFGG